MLAGRTEEAEARWLVCHKNALSRTASGRVQLVCMESLLDNFDVRSQREALQLVVVGVGEEGDNVVVSEEIACPVNSI